VEEAQQPAPQPAPPPESIVDSEGYAQAINACLSEHPELAEMAGKFFAIAAIEELDGVLEEIGEVVLKATMSKGDKEKIMALVGRGREVAGDFLEDDEDDEEDGE
jgi:hypothetical protein